MKVIDSKVKNAPRFLIAKMGRLDPDKPTQVYIGQKEIGEAFVPKKDESGEYIGFYGPLADGRPIVGEPILVWGGHMSDWLRTSIVKDYCIINDSEGKDKVVLPKDFRVEEFGTPKNLQDGDLMVLTMNSVYVMYKLDHLDNTRLSTLLP